MAEQPDTIDPLFKLRNSPLEGVEAYRSPFYRRLLSAGYKGYIQGSLGGATLFAAFGAAAGVLIAAGAMAIVPALSVGAAFIAVPVMAGAGLLYGKEAFGTIGAVAAISAEQAELSEKRRSLLDRYFETPSREEAREIVAQLKEQGEERTPKKWFHWKAAILGALVVGTAVAALALMPALIGGSGLAATEFGAVAGKLLGIEVAKLSALPAAYVVGAGLVGALSGSLIGIDRAYIRKWFDVQERFHDDGDIKSKRVEHQQAVQRLQEAYRAEGFKLESRGIPVDFIARDNATANRTAPISPRAVSPTPTQLEVTQPEDNAPQKPDTKIDARDAKLENRVSQQMSQPIAAL